FSSYVYHCDLPSFPTRRSSDLVEALAGDGDRARVRLLAAGRQLGGGPALVDRRDRDGAGRARGHGEPVAVLVRRRVEEQRRLRRDRKSTRLNSSHVAISYAVFC